jgi:hypothetical protein
MPDKGHTETRLTFVRRRRIGRQSIEGDEVLYVVLRNDTKSTEDHWLASATNAVLKSGTLAK